MLRNVLSSVASIDVPVEYAEAVREQRDAAIRSAYRESYSKDRWGQFSARAALITYESPDTGEDRWGAYYTDDAVEELEEADSREEAEERYEENVRALADCAAPDKSWWQVTDVDGVPVCEDDDEDEYV